MYFFLDNIALWMNTLLLFDTSGTKHQQHCSTWQDRPFSQTICQFRRKCDPLQTSVMNLHLWRVSERVLTLDWVQVRSSWQSLRAVCANDSKPPAPCCALRGLSQTQDLATESARLRSDPPNSNILPNLGSSYSSSVDAATAAEPLQVPHILQQWCTITAMENVVG